MIEINVEIGVQNGTDCYEVKSVNILPYNLRLELENILIDGKSFNKLEDLEHYVKGVVKNTLSNVDIVFLDENA